MIFHYSNNTNWPVQISLNELTSQSLLIYKYSPEDFIFRLVMYVIHFLKVTDQVSHPCTTTDKIVCVSRCSSFRKVDWMIIFEIES